MCLACSLFDQSHTGEAVTQWIEDRCDFGNSIQEVNLLFTDTASNMQKMMEYLPAHF